MLFAIKIAYRNVIKNKKQSILIGLALFISLFIFIMTNSVANGLNEQILKRYINIQSGHVTILWDNVTKNVKNNFHRIYDSMFEIENPERNVKSIQDLKQYINNSKEIEYFHTTIGNAANVVLSQKILYSYIYGLDQSVYNYLLETETMSLTKGGLPFDNNYNVLISDNFAQKHRIKLNDWINISCTTPYGAQNSMELKVSGIYSNLSPWDNYNLYITNQNAREIFDYDEGLFNFGRIFLKNPNKIDPFLHSLNKFLKDNNSELIAESYKEASTVIVNFSKNQKMFFNVFNIFIFFILVIGISSTVRINIFRKMKEIGTLSAIGFSRFQNFLILFFETFILAILSLSASLLLSYIIISAINIKGIYISNETINYALGSAKIFLKLNTETVSIAFLITMIISLLASWKSILYICLQKITNNLRETPKRIFVSWELLKNIFS